MVFVTSHFLTFQIFHYNPRHQIFNNSVNLNTNIIITFI